MPTGLALGVVSTDPSLRLGKVRRVADADPGARSGPNSGNCTPSHRPSTPPPQAPTRTPRLRSGTRQKLRARSETGPRRSSGFPLPSRCPEATPGDPGTKNSDAGTTRVRGALGAGWGQRAKGEPRLKGAESRGGDCFQPVASTFIHPQRLAPVGHRTGLRGRAAARRLREASAPAPRCACAAPPLPPPLGAPPISLRKSSGTLSQPVCRRMLTPLFYTNHETPSTAVSSSQEYRGVQVTTQVKVLES